MATDLIKGLNYKSRASAKYLIIVVTAIRFWCKIIIVVIAVLTSSHSPIANSRTGVNQTAITATTTYYRLEQYTITRPIAVTRI